jgi:predicted dehydrogenase
MPSQARIAVIGAGWWSTQAHIPALRANRDVALVALCDADPARLRAAAAAYGIATTYTDYHELLAREPLDAAVIATPHVTHYQIARDCLASGLHVLVEKPMTLYAADARVLVELARQRGRELIVGYPWNYTRQARHARDLLASGALGAMQFISCIFNSYNLDLLSGRDRSDQPQAYPVHGPGAVYSQPQLSGGGHGHLQITHSAGLMFFTTGLRARRVIALMHNHGLPLDLVDAMTVEFESGTLGVIGGTSNARPSRLDLQIACVVGGIDLDMITATTRARRPDGTQEEIAMLEGREQAYPQHAPADNLVDVVLGRAPNGSPGEIGWRTVELLDAAYRSARADGQAVLIADLYSPSSQEQV